MDAFQKLVTDFIKFPGIGKRQAERFAYFLLHKDTTEIDRFISDIKQAHGASKKCTHCFRLFTSDIPSTICRICANTNRDHSLLMILNKEADIDALEKSGSYHGYYFLLGELVDFGDQEKLLQLPRVQHLKTRLQDDAELKEIIFALPFNPEGEHTRLLLEEVLTPIAKERALTLSTLGRGLSTGTELEYSDKETLQYAIQSRITK